MRSKFFLSLALLMISAGISAQIYTWKDEKGRVHFSDTPPANVDARPPRGRVAVSPPPAASGSAPAAQSGAAAGKGPQTWAEKDLEYRQRRAAEAQSRAASDKDAATKAENAEYCNSLTRNISLLERGGRITRPGANGEPEFLSEEQIKSEANKLRERQARDCK